MSKISELKPLAVQLPDSANMLPAYTDGSSEPWLTDSDGGRERDDWRLTDGGGGLS